MSSSKTKTKMERMKTYADVESKIFLHRIQDEIGGQILLRMLNNYLLKGTTYIDKYIKLYLRGDRPRVIHVNLYNDKNKVDTVVISAQETTTGQ